MRSILTLVFWIIVTPLIGVITIPWTLLTRDARLLYRLGMGAALMGARIAGVRWTLVGLDGLDLKRNYIFMSNHVSNLDPPVLIPLIPGRTSVLVKKELFRIPIVGYAMRIAELVPIDRSNREAAIAGMRDAAAVLRKGFSLTVFPEGTRSRDGKLLPFKKGPFYLALESGTPIVPVTILGTEQLQPKGKLLAKPGHVTIVFHSPIEPAKFPDRDTLMQVTRDAVASALPVERR